MWTGTAGVQQISLESDTSWRLANCPCLAASVLWRCVGHLSKRAHDEVHRLGGDDEADQVLGADEEIHHGLGGVDEVDHGPNGQCGNGLALSGTRWRPVDW